MAMAHRLETDIRRRRLSPGSRYLTAEEGATLLGTSIATADRALRILADQEIVVRRRNSGTFVGPAMVPDGLADLRIVNILLPASERACRTIRLDPLIDGLLAHINDIADVRCSYVPAIGDLDFVRSVLEPCRNQIAGVVAVSCSYEVYQYLGENGFPFVVMGSLYPGQNFASIDTDEQQAGYLLAHHLMERGHRRLTLLSNSESRPGDRHFHDGVNQALTEGGLPPSALLLRSPGANPAMLTAQVKELLQMDDRPTGFIARLPHWADEVAKVVKTQGLKVPKNVEIVFSRGCNGIDAGNSSFPHVRSSLTLEEIGQRVGQMMAQCQKGDAKQSASVIVPCELCT